MKNWESTIRNEVNAHENYAGLSAFTGRETSDIVYEDTSGAFTKILCDCHYLDPTIWLNKTPEYLIEVKTTTTACEDPFYVSAAQYKLVRTILASLTRANLSHR